MLERIKNEPALLSALIGAIIVLVVAFGIPISEDQKAAIVGVVGVIVLLLGGGVVRQQVKPKRLVK